MCVSDIGYLVKVGRIILEIDISDIGSLSKCSIVHIFRSARTSCTTPDFRMCQKFHSLRGRPTQLAELPCSEFDPELLPHSTYVNFFMRLAAKVPYITFCDKM